MLIDTNVWSELVRQQPDPAVLAFLGTRRDELHLSTVVVAEMEYGLARHPDPVRRKVLRAFIDDLTLRCEGRIVGVTVDTAKVFGEIKARLRAEGQIIAELDALIAAQAVSAAMPLATRNVSDMARTGAHIINPWEH